MDALLPLRTLVEPLEGRLRMPPSGNQGGSFKTWGEQKMAYGRGSSVDLNTFC